MVLVYPEEIVKVSSYELSREHGSGDVGSRHAVEVPRDEGGLDRGGDGHLGPVHLLPGVQVADVLHVRLYVPRHVREGPRQHTDLRIMVGVMAVVPDGFLAAHGLPASSDEVAGGLGDPSQRRGYPILHVHEEQDRDKEERQRGGAHVEHRGKLPALAEQVLQDSAVCSDPGDQAESEADDNEYHDDALDKAAVESVRPEVLHAVVGFRGRHGFEQVDEDKEIRGGGEGVEHAGGGAGAQDDGGQHDRCYKDDVERPSRDGVPDVVPSEVDMGAVERYPQVSEQDDEEHPDDYRERDHAEQYGEIVVRQLERPVEHPVGQVVEDGVDDGGGDHDGHELLDVADGVERGRR